MNPNDDCKNIVMTFEYIIVAAIFKSIWLETSRGIFFNFPKLFGVGSRERAGARTGVLTKVPAQWHIPMKQVCVDRD